MSAFVLVAAVTVIGAVRVLTKGPVPTGVPSALINVALTSAKEKEERSLKVTSEHTSPAILQDKHPTPPLLHKRGQNKAKCEADQKATETGTRTEGLW